MAQKKKSQARKPATTTQKSKPSTPSYEELLTARRAVDSAQAELYRAAQRSRSAYATQGDFAARDAAYAQAQAELAEARSNAAAATRYFEDLKMKARKNG